jgi:CDGSH-type Zn-finger protein/uncharacterized Fe-S cluster protein YjdI
MRLAYGRLRGVGCNTFRMIPPSVCTSALETSLPLHTLSDMNDTEKDLEVSSREGLLYQLVEAAELEHNLMCCYFYAAWSIKDARDGLSAAHVAEVAQWKRGLIGVAIEEMTHLALVNNLLLAFGGAPHFSRPNFPVSPGLHPASVVVELAPFSRDTLDHFIFLERPEGNLDRDGASFASIRGAYKREMPKARLMPSAQDFETVGHFYRSLQRAVDRLSEQYGTRGLFLGDPALQVGPDLVKLPGLRAIHGIEDARLAFDTVVTQGEGATIDAETSHYRRLVRIRERWDALLAVDPSFEPGRPAARNPVMRRPPTPAGKVFLEEDRAGHVVDLGNTLYVTMLRALTQGFAETDPARKSLLLDVAIDGMFALSPIGEYATTLAASASHPGVRAGLSFATLRSFSALPPGEAASTLLCERLLETADRAREVFAGEASMAQTEAQIAALAAKLGGTRRNGAKPRQIEVAKGKELTILFEAKRCIHARSCVLSAPSVFKANTPGEWIFPDTVTPGALVAVAENCPSGAIQYERPDGTRELAPSVNTLHVRERGPYALRGAIVLGGEALGTRATLCRCGASANKPYCDGSHTAAKFDASGEPETRASEPLATRDGVLTVAPQRNGPLLLKGNLEICAGTGRTVDRVTQCALCRCGQSKNKPFCDGTHAHVGFVAEPGNS